jgi:hypothetical protein
MPSINNRKRFWPTTAADLSSSASVKANIQSTNETATLISSASVQAAASDSNATSVSDEVANLMAGIGESKSETTVTLPKIHQDLNAESIKTAIEGLAPKLAENKSTLVTITIPLPKESLIRQAQLGIPRKNYDLQFNCTKNIHDKTSKDNNIEITTTYTDINCK